MRVQLFAWEFLQPVPPWNPLTSLTESCAIQLKCATAFASITLPMLDVLPE